MRVYRASDGSENLRGENGTRSYRASMSTPLGEVHMESDGESLTGLRFDCPASGLEVERGMFEETRAWLEKWFAGEMPDFTPRIRLEGTEFQKEVWEILLKIPYGETVSYKRVAEEVARRRGLPPKRMSAQAVGGAVGRNPIAIIVPCHRVIGSDGSLTGYRGGLWRKRWMLEHECRNYTQKLRLE